MTNITLSIEDEVYKKMREHSEIKWSEFVRKMIKNRIEELESLDENNGYLTMMASEKALKEAWDNELDQRWDEV